MNIVKLPPVNFALFCLFTNIIFAITLLLLIINYLEVYLAGWFFLITI
jgi:hypothetical protein